MLAIADIQAYEILDSRGSPTLSVTVRLGNGIFATAAVPCGASIGKREAVELRDHDPARYRGRGVLRAIANIQELIAPRLRGMEVTDQTKIDLALRQLDGAAKKAPLGANATIGVSLAVARAAAVAQGLPFYMHLAFLAGETHLPDASTPYVVPAPMIGVLNGGRHANNTLDIQEFMLLPTGAPTFAEAVRWGADIFYELKQLLERRRLSSAVGDAGGFAPDLPTHEAAFELIVAAISAAGYRPGKDVSIAVDLAASELFHAGGYLFKQSGGTRQSPAKLIETYRGWMKQYPIVSIEDGMGENDRAGWKELTSTVGGKIQLVGDDVFVTNPDLLSRGIRDGIANAVLVKPNQIGTLTETLDTIRCARAAGYATVVSGRSGETEDAFIADLAVGTATRQIKAGSLCRCEHTAKYNRLLAIERELGPFAVYGGKLLRKNGNGARL